MTTWNDLAKVEEYTGRVGRLAARLAGEQELVDALPATVTRALDLGCGDGRLLELVLVSRAETLEGIGIDSSPPMLDLASERFADDARVTIVEGNLQQPISGHGSFDVIVSGFAIHHLADDRKRSLLGEIATALRPGGLFANLEVIACATPELQEEFNQRIGRPGGDPEDLLAPIDDQLGWMRSAGLTQVDCQWRWRGFALLVGRAPASADQRS
ncbi:MAG: class I SAM-dependent methyltransferase [Aquihabitans sp.]